MHIIDAEKSKLAGQNGGLKIAGASGELKQEDAFGIVLSVDKDEATQRAERDREAAAKRQQLVAERRRLGPAFCEHCRAPLVSDRWNRARIARDLRAHEAMVDGELDFESEGMAMERAARTGSARLRQGE